MKYTNKQIRTIYESLPLDIREVIASMEYTEKIQTISKKYKLMIDKTGTLSEETGFVLMGITKPQDFVNNIQNRLEVSRDIAMGIAEEINTQIFYELRESLKQILSKKTENFETEKEEDGESLLAGSLLGKTEDEELNREDILREIEDKEHHNLPTVSTPELHLEASPPSELVVKQPDEIMVATSENQPIAPTTETPATIKSDIVKDKMSGIVNIPKETVIINDSVSPTKTNPTKVDPYRERTT